MDLQRILMAVGREPWQGRVVLSVSLVLVVLIAHQLAGLTWRIAAPTDPLAGGPGTPAATADPLPDPARIAGHHLFGRAGGGDTPLLIDAPDTRLNLTLRGIASDSDATASRVLIAGPDGVEKVYAVGASVPGGATVHEILTDRVLLDRRGTLETLRLPRHGTSDAVAVAASTPTARVVDNLQEQAGANALAEVVRLQAVMADGQLRGYRVYPGRDRQRFAALGLRAGDLVTALNGVALEDPVTSLEALQAIAGSDQVTLTVERGGQIENLTLRLER